MKKLLLIIVAILLGFRLSAQCPLTEAVDFTATDIHGTTVHLFDILDGGQYVLIDFFYNSCGPCNIAVPKVVEAYHALGCNAHEVFFMEISPYDGDDVLMNWCNTYGVEYPTIGTSGGGSSLCSTYGITAYPTLILIAPNRQIVIQDLWPINNAQTIISALAPYGIEEHECGTVADPTVDIALGEVTTTTVEASFTPNETCASYYILLSTAQEMQNWVMLMGKTLEELVQMWGLAENAAYTNVWTDLIPNTEYTVYALPLGADSTFYEMQTSLVTTQAAGGTGTSVIDIDVSVLSETSVKTVAVPNGETAQYHYGLITKEYYKEIGADSALVVIRSNGYPLYANDEWTWVDLQPNTYYYALGTGINANGEWGETTLVEFMTSLTGVETSDDNSISMFPNPANDYIKVSGEHIGKVIICNALGQVMQQYAMNGNETIIPTSSFPEGIYFIKTDNGTVRRFVIAR